MAVATGWHIGRRDRRCWTRARATRVARRSTGSHRPAAGGDEGGRMNCCWRWSTIAVLTVVIAGCTPSSGQAPERAGGATDPALDLAFEQFVDKYLREVRGVGGSLPADMSAASFAQRIQTQRTLLEELQRIDRSKLTFDQQIDWQFLDGILKSNIREEEQVQRWRQDPRRYVDTNSITFKLQADPRPPEDRGRALVNDMKTLQARVANGAINLTQYVPQWLPYSNARIDGTILHFENSIPEFSARLSPSLAAELTAETEKTIAALREFRTVVNERWVKLPVADFKIGAELFNYLQATRHFFDGDDLDLRTIARGAKGFLSVPQYFDWGWKQYRITEKMLEARAAQIAPGKPWLQIIKDMKRVHPAAEQLVYEGLKIARWPSEWTSKNDLVTIPWTDDDQIMVASDPSLSASQWWGFGPGYLPAGH